MIHHLANFGTLTQRGFGVIQTTVIDDLRKLFHEVIIIPFSTLILNYKTLDKRKTTKI